MEESVILLRSTAHEMWKVWCCVVRGWPYTLAWKAIPPTILNQTKGANQMKVYVGFVSDLPEGRFFIAQATDFETVERAEMATTSLASMSPAFAMATVKGVVDLTKHTNPPTQHRMRGPHPVLPNPTDKWVLVEEFQRVIFFRQNVYKPQNSGVPST
jgi:hypothetical protein